jgi:hypothetical protein
MIGVSGLYDKMEIVEEHGEIVCWQTHPLNTSTARSSCWAISTLQTKKSHMKLIMK